MLSIEYDSQHSGSGRLKYWIDDDAISKLENEFFGKRILITNRSDWSDEEIMVAYRGQSHVEDTFRQLEELSGILDLLGEIRLAMVLKPSGNKGGRPRVLWQLEDASPDALSLLRQLVPAKAPFVYTDGIA